MLMHLRCIQIFFSHLFVYLSLRVCNVFVTFTFISELDLREASIIQEFIANPFLIDGHKFSIGVYVVFSSAKPLRAYILNNTWELRFSSKPYMYDNISASDPGRYITDGPEFGMKRVGQARIITFFSFMLNLGSTISAAPKRLRSRGSFLSKVHPLGTVSKEAERLTLWKERYLNSPAMGL